MASYREWELNNGNHRSPIYVRLKERSTGFEFVFMTNHLARGKSELRQQQAGGLREWARDSQMPIIAMGDFNFDFSFKSQSGNEAFNLFLKDGVWKWIRPKEEIDSNWADRDGDGIDNYPDSMLDFAFVANEIKELKCECEIVVRDGDFPSDETTSDHRPTVLVVEL
jgi:endonuclease/exonuclease/phosphatase family metal-dependent hydrolase